MTKYGWASNIGDGIMAPGGSIANMYGMVLARHKMFPETKKEGVACIGKPLVAFTSEESHYSIVKSANWLGLGMDNVVKVKTDVRGRMIDAELDKAIVKAKANGKIPFFVNGTSGSTVMGSFDPLDKLSAVCKKHGGIWLHVDGAWGGSFILSEKHKHQLKVSKTRLYLKFATVVKRNYM
jgi:glutamate/tyrosine decarboxylase-like PLP-dependent enzyme